MIREVFIEKMEKVINDIHKDNGYTCLAINEQFNRLGIKWRHNPIVIRYTEFCLKVDAWAAFHADTGDHITEHHTERLEALTAFSEHCLERGLYENF